MAWEFWRGIPTVSRELDFDGEAGNIERISADTYARENDFYSFRRATHRSEADYGRELSAIALIA